MIKITVVSYNNEAPADPVSAVFGPEPATIGRNVENFLALPDPKHFVSRTQANIWSTGTQHFITNLSLANPVSINGKEIVAETVVEFHAGDEIQVGLYVLRAEAVETAESAGNSIATEATVQAEAAPEVKIDEIKSDEIKANIPAEVPPFSQPAVRLQAGKDSLPAQPPQFLLRPEVLTPQADTVADADTKPVAQTEVAVTDAQSSPSSQVSAAKPDTAKTASAVSHTAANANELMQAFLQGAGLQQLNLSSGLTVELMETLGKFMATSVQGAMEELSQRALLKREVKAEVTMVVLRENNPLKFFPDSKTVLTQMLRKKMPGFMAPAEAMEDAFFDIRTHQMGVAAGTRAITDAILKTLQPSHVEAQLGTPGLMDQINPARRKAAMWDQFNALYDGISSGKKDEFQAMFGKEFLLAYEKEVEKAESNR
ncbi:MAG: type VI secretion system-associated FHA domain protein TagH [Burkholderiales bacterium]|nr:type VI secretion system-associated FHA domain protein TagH [Burkholderiales bacterium]MBI3727190.1 type VI secretion system-associated FHA domain protein TagH [Burkholderiales bacterium]